MELHTHGRNSAGSLSRQCRHTHPQIRHHFTKTILFSSTNASMIALALLSFPLLLHFRIMETKHWEFKEGEGEAVRIRFILLLIAPEKLFKPNYHFYFIFWSNKTQLLLFWFLHFVRASYSIRINIKKLIKLYNVIILTKTKLLAHQVM